MVLCWHLKVTIKSIKTIVENVLEEAGSLSTHNGISRDGLKVSVG